MKEKDKIKSLEKQIKQLKELLVKKDMDMFITDTYLEITAKSQKLIKYET